MRRRRKRHFFPSVDRVQRRWAAIGERQLQGMPTKLPWENWKEAFLKRKVEGVKKMAELGGAAIHDWLRGGSITRRILLPQEQLPNPILDAAVKLHQDFPLSTEP